MIFATSLKSTLRVLFLIVFATSSLQIADKSIAAEAEVKAPAIAFAARLVGDNNRARLIVDFDQKISQRVYLIDDPRRIVVELPETIFTLPRASNALPKTLIGMMRYGTTAPGQSRIVLELNRAGRVEKHRVKALADRGRYRLIVDIIQTTDEKFAALARKNSAQTPPKKDTAKKRQFKIVLDPGHGGIDGGAIGRKRTNEKKITLNFAKKLRARLQSDPNFIVLMTRDQDKFVSLDARLEIARRSKADLFISIHADSLAQAHIRGATVYTLNENGSDAISRALARKQNKADLIAGLSLPETKPSVTDILIDLTRRETEVFSVRFAKLMVEKLKDNVRLIGNPHRSADFYVLKAPEVPSVLLELGYMSNAEDESLMQTPQWQETAVSKTVEAINAFFAPRLLDEKP